MKVMTFNVLCHGCEGHDWFDRQDDVIATVRNYMPDIFGLQEAHLDWMKAFRNNMPEYDYVGVGRDDGKEDGEFSPVFYKKDKFDFVEGNTFWISETPDVPSRSWETACTRVCSYAKLRDKASGKEFIAMNTHLDHVSVEARKNGVRLINEFAKKLDCPVVITGDFNIPEKTDCYPDMIGYGVFRDTKYVAPVTEDTFTFHEFFHHNGERSVIDFIFINDGFDAAVYHVIQDKIDGAFPSDHCPVIADIDFK